MAVKPQPHLVGGVYEKRARNRLARVRLNNPNALPNVNAGDGFTRGEARRIRRAAHQLPHQPAAPAQPAKPKPYVFNPLAPLNPNTAGQEINAATRMKYGAAEQAVAQEIANQTQTVADTGSYYDDYKKALDESAARMKENNDAIAQQQQGLVDTGAAQEKARIAAEDAQQAEQAAKFGRPATPDEKGAQAAEAERARGTDAVTNLRAQGAANYDYAQKGSANSRLAKIEAVQRAQGKLTQALAKKTQLKGDEGAFKVSQRQSLRDSERTYALARKEFGLKAEDVKSQIATRKAQVSASKQAANATVLVAKIYAASNRAQARATIRVAKLQLQKGKIDRSQYRKIVNIYRGLPKHGQPTPAKNAGGPQPAPINIGGSGGQGSGPNGTWSPSERKQIDQAVQNLIDHHVQANQRSKVIGTLVRNGLSRNQALAAWGRYAKNHLSGGSRPDTAGNPNVSGH